MEGWTTFYLSKTSEKGLYLPLKVKKWHMNSIKVGFLRHFLEGHPCPGHAGSSKVYHYTLRFSLSQIVLKKLEATP